MRLDQQVAEVSPAKRHLRVLLGIIHLLEEHEMGHCHAVDALLHDVSPTGLHDEVDVIDLEPLVPTCFRLNTDV